MNRNMLRVAVKLYTKRANTKEEAFLKGYLVALELIDYEAKKILSKSSFRIEKGIPNIYKQVRLKLIEEANSVLTEIRKN